MEKAEQSFIFAVMQLERPAGRCSAITCKLTSTVLVMVTVGHEVGQEFCVALSDTGRTHRRLLSGPPVRPPSSVIARCTGCMQHVLVSTGGDASSNTANSTLPGK